MKIYGRSSESGKIIIEMNEGKEKESFLRLLEAGARCDSVPAEDQILGEKIVDLVYEI